MVSDVRKISTIVLATLFFFGPGIRATPTDDSLPWGFNSTVFIRDESAAKSNQIDAFLATIVSGKGPGVGVIVIQDGKVVYKKGHGLANVKEGIPIRVNTAFEIASLTKQFTAMAIMMLAERGQLSYDDSIQRFFPDIDSRGARITVRHLLSHTSGMRDSLTSLLGEDTPKRPKDIVAFLSETKSALSAPGERFIYSNSGYITLALIVEIVSGMSFPLFIKENIFRPLGMDNSIVFDGTKREIQNLALSYIDEAATVGHSPTRASYGHIGIISTLDDLFRWDQALYTEKLVKQTSLKQALAPAKLNNGDTVKYGFGWETGIDHGLRYVGHHGRSLGYRAHMRRYDNEHFTVIVLANGSHIWPQTIARKIARMYLGDRMALPKPISIDPRRLREYAGRYTIAGGNYFEIILENSDLWIKSSNREEKNKLLAKTVGEFIDDDTGETHIVFIKNEKGLVIGFELKIETDDEKLITVLTANKVL
ncbi:MAG TPA: serine hydrolase [Blastocatellia bacterium]|nr:serine hydrolase [Blastocatellia bacterium]